ncbi:hypothetical protein ABID26_006515 [Mesorhizobium shonense]|uniref:Uncharacterized protein n=1 Tax=Mesorhizobium shonense TaxID=1209948 RepID=A0ABV2I2V1_9HYPH|nr:hypothetical protein [Mesorhizobium sp.]
MSEQSLTENVFPAGVDSDPDPTNACRPEVYAVLGQRHASKQGLKARRLNPFQRDAL